MSGDDIDNSRVLQRIAYALEALLQQSSNADAEALPQVQELLRQSYRRREEQAEEITILRTRLEWWANKSVEKEPRI